MYHPLVRWLLLFLAATGCESGFQRVPGDGGADMANSWQVVAGDSDDGGTLRAVFGVDENDVHAVGDEGRVLDWDGNSLTELNMGSGYDLTSGWAANHTDQWITAVIHGTPNGILFHLGTSPPNRWVQANTAPIPNGLLGVWGSGDKRFATGYNGIIYSTDTMGPFHMGNSVPANACHGSTTFAPLLWQVSGNSPTSVGVAGDACTAYFFDGINWNGLINPDSTRSFRSAFGAPGNITDIYFGANYYGLWHFDGSTLEIQINEERDQAQNISLFTRAIWGPDAQHLVAVGDLGRIMTYDTGTQKVKILPSPTTRTLYGIWGASLDDVWIVGEGGLVLRGAVPF
jgi:hypothetical protein